MLALMAAIFREAPASGDPQSFSQLCLAWPQSLRLDWGCVTASAPDVFSVFL